MLFSYIVIAFKDPVNIKLKKVDYGDYYKCEPGVYTLGKSAPYTINSKGFRNKEFAKKEKFRVICMGASSTMGLQSEDWETWPSRLEQSLNNVEVINCGLGGLSSFHHVAMVEEINSYEPDLVLYYAGYNDHSIVAVERYPGPERISRLAFFKLWMRWKKTQLRFLIMKYSGYDIEPLTPIDRWLLRYRANLESIVKDLDAPIIIITQALNYPADIRETAMEGGDITAKLNLAYRDWQVYFRHMDILKIQKRISKKYGILIVNTGEFYDGGDELFYDIVHLTPKGNKCLAEVIAEEISSNRQLNPIKKRIL